VPRSETPYRCQCLRVRGRVLELAPDTANRCVCYCHDCRAFAHHLGRGDLVDARGGADIVQVARARLVIDEGLDQLRCLRLTPGGLFRWYADCCKTPMANTLPRVPFAGLCRSALDVAEAQLPTADLIHGRSAVGGLPPGASAGLSLRSIARPGRLFASWMASGLGHPTPLFDRSGKPRVEPRVLTASERQALREHPRA